MSSAKREPIISKGFPEVGGYYTMHFVHSAAYFRYLIKEYTFIQPARKYFIKTKVGLYTFLLKRLQFYVH